MNENITVRLDRVQFVSWAPQGHGPPKLNGFVTARDYFVRCQTTTGTYARCRELHSLTDDAKIFWQYQRLKGWLKQWKITMVANDKSGLSYAEIENVLKHCRFYRFLIAEVAVDFCPSTGVDRDFVRHHFLFGKSRERKQTKFNAVLRKPKN